MRTAIIPYGEINFAEIIIALVPAYSLIRAHARDGPFVELLRAQLLSSWLQKECPPHPSTRLRRLRTGMANIGRFALRKLPENAARTHHQLHAMLGGHAEITKI